MSPSSVSDGGYIIYATTPSGGIVSYSAGIVSDAGFGFGPASDGLPSTDFAYGQPTSLSISPDGKHVYAATAGDAVIYVLNCNRFASGQLTFDRVLGNTAIDHGSDGLNGIYHNVALGQTGLLGGAADFNGSNSYVQIGGADVTTAWTAEFVLDTFGITSSSDLLRGSAAALKLAQFPSLGQVGYTQFNVADYLFNPTLITPVGQYVNLTWEGDPNTGVSIYLNGQLVGSNSNFMTLPRGSIGEGTTFAPNARLDEAILYRRALPAAELLTHVRSSAPTDLTDPVSLALRPTASSCMSPRVACPAPSRFTSATPARDGSP